MNEDLHHVMEMAIEVSGSILRQAEWERDFTKIYTRVFEKILELQLTENPEILQILGNLGG
ncbi:MAG: hypothetical protein QXO57_03530 [Candidatus Aenigmatarchaeota archaeon]|nr:hypothetical protein [Candidatus Aenigmarchaeota archaeon]